MQEKIIQWGGMFCVGVRDAVSLGWVKGILLYSDPQTMRILPASQKLLKTLTQSIVQVGLILTLIPYLLWWLGLDFLAILWNILTLLLTYGYLFFYNSEIMTLTKDVVLWRNNRVPDTYPDTDRKYKFALFTNLSNQVQSIIFLVLFYIPIYATTLTLTMLISTVGPICLVLSESFFNSVFYFLRKWPYDRYNIGFMEVHFAYFLGYGIFISIVCNLLVSPFLGRSLYFLISQWMIINTVLFSPPVVEFNSLKHIADILLHSSERKKLRNAYNVHRELVNENEAYRERIINNIFLFKPLFLITEYLNSKIFQMLNKKTKEAFERKEQFAQQKEHEEKMQ